MLSPQHHKELSKYLSLVLRHEPEKVGLTLGPDGFVPLADLLAAMRRKPRWKGVTEALIREVVITSDKQRFEIVGENIRARYGHSVEERITYPEVEPPEVLYHGTSPRALPSIREQGLQPMSRQYIHLSTYVEQARTVGRRHHPRPVILTVEARAAWQSGIKFYSPEPRLYLSDAIPPAFLQERVDETVG